MAIDYNSIIDQFDAQGSPDHEQQSAGNFDYNAILDKFDTQEQPKEKSWLQTIGDFFNDTSKGSGGSKFDLNLPTPEQQRAKVEERTGKPWQESSSSFEAGVMSGAKGLENLYQGGRMWWNDITGDEVGKLRAYEDYLQSNKESDQLSKGHVTSYKDVHNATDAGSYVAYMTGNALPSVALSLVTGVAGGIVGAAAGKVATGAASAVAKKAVEGAISKQVASGVARDVAEKQVAAKIGAGLGLFAQGYAMGTGDIYGETINDKTMTGSKWTTAIGAVPYSLLEMVTEVGVLGKLGKGSGEGVLKRFIKAAAADSQKEGMTEALQEAELMLAGIQSGKTYNWDTVSRRLGDSYFGGMIPGAGMGGIEAAGQHGEVKQESPTEGPVIDQVLSSADNNGLVRVDALPGMIRERLQQERPDTIRPGGLFSGDKVHASVVEDMLKSDAVENQPAPGKAVGDTPSVTGGGNIDIDAQDLMSAQTPEELTQKMETVLGSGLMQQEAPAAPESSQQDVIGATTQDLQEAPQEGSKGLADTIDEAFPETVRRGDGRPFSTEAAADTYARHQGITDFTVTPDGEGFALRTKKAPKLEQEAGTPGAQLESDVAELVSEPAPVKPRIKGKSAVASERMIPLTHWGDTAGLTELDPLRHGGDRIYYGMPGYQLEDAAASSNKARYFTAVPAKKLYDLSADPDGLRAKAEAKVKAREDQYFSRKGSRIAQPVTVADLENEVKLAGYRGYYVGDVAALFDKQPVKEVTNEPMDVVGVAGYDERGSQKPTAAPKASKVLEPIPAAQETQAPVENKPAAPKKEKPTTEAATTTSENAATAEKVKPRIVKNFSKKTEQASQRSKKVTGYSAEEAPDYAKAAATLAKSKGFTDDQINEAIKRSDDEQRDGERVGRGDVGTGRTAGARRGDAGLPGDGAQPVRGNEGQARGFTPQEMADFEREREAARAAGAKYSVIDREAQHHAELAQISPEREDRIRRKVENVSAWFAKHDGVDVVGTVDDLPFEAPPNTRAAAWKGRVYIVADAFSSKSEARDAYAHELVGHLKAEQVEGYSDILTEVANDQNRTGVIKDIWQTEQAKRPWAAPDELAREVVAVLAERESKHPLIRRLVNLYRGILKRFGAINPTEGKIYDIIAKAYRGTNVTHDNTPWFSVSTPGVTDRALYKAAMQFVDDTTALAKAEEITGVKDVRREVLLQRSYVVNDVDAALDKFVKPMELQRRKYGFTSEQVSKFLHARHAWEANDQLRLRNIERMKADGIIPQSVDPTDPLLDLRTIPGMMDQSNPKYGYWKDLWEAPAGMTDADAHDIMREWQADPNMQDIGDMADAIGAERLRLMVDSGLITQDRADQLSTAYEHYVPLFREMPDNSEMAAIRARGKPGSKKPIRIRKGSSRQVSDVYSNLVTDFQKVIIQASKNSVFRDFVSELNRVNGGGMFDVNGKSETVDLDAAGNIVTRDTLVTDPNFSISGYVKGKRTYIVAKDGDPLAADVVRAWNNMDAQTVGAFMRRVAGMARVISKMVTSLSIDFLVANPVRDLQTAMWNVTGKEVGGAVSGRAKMARDWVKAFSQIYGHLVFGTSGNYADIFKRMGETGGRMSWLEMFPDEPGKNMAHIHARYDKRWYHPGEGAARNAVMAKNRMLETIGAFFEHLGSASENATRAVVWKAARDAELSRGTGSLEAEKRASIIAREVTADFLRHGTQSKKLGALYMFFNPSVQSTVKAVSRIVENPAQRIPALAAAVVASTLISMLARSWSDDDDDDGILNIDEPTVEYSKDRNMVFPVPKEMATLPGGGQAMLTVPVPYFYNIFSTTGNIIGDVISGALKAPTEKEDFNSPAMRAAFRIMNVTLESLSPLGSPFTAGWMQFLSPTIGDLFVQAKDNETAWGTNLYPPKSGAWDKRLMWQRSFRSTPEVYKEAGKAIHDYVFMGGENDEGIGDNLNLELLSNPEVLQNIAQQFGGGFVSLAEKTANFAEKGRVQDITGVRRFVTSAEPDRDLITKWHAVSTRMDGLNQDLKTATGEQKRELWKTNKDMQLLMRYNDTDKKLSSLRRLKSKAKEGTAQYKKIQDRINEIQSGFIKSYNRMRAEK